jgi:peptide/nickel transport system permease protein
MAVSQAQRPNLDQRDARDVRPRGLWSDAWRSLTRNRAALFGLLIVVLLVGIAVFGPALAPHDPNEQDLDRIKAAPTWEHPFGTDQLGRDYFSRILAGARTALLVGLTVTVLSCGLGVLLGAAAAFFGGWVDLIVSRALDMALAFPKLLLAAFVNAVAKPPFQGFAAMLAERTGIAMLADTVMVDYIVVLSALALTLWPSYARLVRGQVLSLRETDFILAARTIGAPPWQIIARHLVPNTLGPIVIAVTVGFGEAMLLESSLGYLGIGIQPPGASWGQMISESLDQWRYSPHLVAAPGIVLAIVVLGFNLLGDGLNDALDPRRR